MPWQLHQPSPCPGRSVQGLVDHLAHSNRLYALLAIGKPAPRVAQRHVARSTFATTGSALLDAFTVPGVLDRGFSSPLGELPGLVIAQHVVNELMVHGWDLARAVGKPTDLLPDVAQRCLVALSASPPLWSRLANGCYAAPKTPPPRADAADRVAARVGRTIF